MRTFTLSIMHSGTTFTEGLLNRWSLGFWHVHVDPPKRVLGDIRAADIVVIPLRRPEAVEESWRNRKRMLGELRQSWRMLQWWAHELETRATAYLPIDSPNRGKYLDELRGFMNEPLTTNWEPLGSRGHSIEVTTERDPIEPEDWSWVYQRPPVSWCYDATPQSPGV